MAVDTRGTGLCLQVRKTVQQQLAQALFKLSVEFRKEETRFLNRMEAQKGLEAGSSLGLVVDDGGQEAAGFAVADPGFTQAQMMRVHQAEGLAQERDEEIRKVGAELRFNISQGRGAGELLPSRVVRGCSAQRRGFA
jgi:hypothetical protein